MRLKTFSAPTMSLAMARVRDSLGQDAIIVSTRNGGADGVTVVAAAERKAFDYGIDGMINATGDALDTIDNILHFHRTPPEVSDPLLRAATDLRAGSDAAEGAVALLAGAIDMRFAFKNIDPATLDHPVVVVGSPGGGKTVACAKLAAAAAISGRPVRLISTDGERAGAAARLIALGERMAIPVEEAADAGALRQKIPQEQSEALIVDTPGINPQDEEEMAWLRALIREVHGTVLLVVPAGVDAIDAAEQALAFAGIGAEAILASRLDTGIRYGSLLAAAQAGKLPLALAGIRPQIGEGLVSLNPVSLARLFAARCDGSPSPFAEIGFGS
ncbi:MAG: flagellar biosynthesis regulator FlhF [Pseudomonadota bacterium]